MTTAKQLRAAARALRADSLDEEAGHFDTHADVLDRAKAVEKIANLDEYTTAADVLSDAEAMLMSYDIRVAPLDAIRASLAASPAPSAVKALDLLPAAPDAGAEVVAT